jgi:proteasome lid subunit RPN8/RPN11
MIQETIKDEIRRHAREAMPEEACGFVLPDGEVMRARNRSQAPLDSFVTDGKTMLEAVSKRASFLYHSHPSGNAKPSALDETSCKRMGIPYLIYSVDQDEFEIFDPFPPWEKLVGLPWQWGKYDCFTIVRDYFALCHGIEIPEYERPDPFPPDYNFYEIHSEDVGFHIVDRPPKLDDVISLHIGTRYENHLAIVLGDQILHHSKGSYSQKQDFTNAWRIRVKHVYRHRDLGEG